MTLPAKMQLSWCLSQKPPEVPAQPNGRVNTTLIAKSRVILKETALVDADLQAKAVAGKLPSLGLRMTRRSTWQSVTAPASAL